MQILLWTADIRWSKVHTLKKQDAQKVRPVFLKNTANRLSDLNDCFYNGCFLLTAHIHGILDVVEIKDIGNYSLQVDLSAAYSFYGGIEKVTGTEDGTES